MVFEAVLENSGCPAPGGCRHVHPPKVMIAAVALFQSVQCVPPGKKLGDLSRSIQTPDLRTS